MKKSAYLSSHLHPLIASMELPLSFRIRKRDLRGEPLPVAAFPGRFCSKKDGFGVLYLAAAFLSAFAEIFVRDGYVRRVRRALHIEDVVTRDVALVRTKRGLRLHLLDLRKDGCIRLGVPTDAVRARNHAASWALGREIYFLFPYIDGIIFPSRMDGGDNSSFLTAAFLS